MIYNEFVFAAQRTLNYETSDTELLDILPRMIEYGELRSYRDLDFLATLAAQTVPLTANNRNVVLPSNIVVTQALNVVTPASQSNPDLGTRNPVTRVGIDFLNAIYPSASGATVPSYYAIIGAPTGLSGVIQAGPLSILLGPTPDQSYTLECIGTVRPAPLSSSNTNTFLSANAPDMFFAACMIFGFGYQRDFGAQSENPQAAQSWEQQYQALKGGVNVEELRKKAASVSWSPYMPTPSANIQRDRASAPPSQ